MSNGNGTQENENSGRRWLLMAIIIILLLINAIQLYLQNQSKQEISQKTETIEKQEQEIKYYNTKIDSIKNELTARYNEIAALGGDTATMGALIRQLKREKKQLSSNFASIDREYRELKSKYDDIMSNKDDEIETLRRERDQLFKENNDLKRKHVSMADSMNELKSKREELSKQVAQAAALKAANVKVIFIRKNKEIEEKEYKAKKLEKLKISFDVIENKIAKIEEKTFYVRLIEPDGAALYDLATGGGSFQVDGKDVYYTGKQSVLYDQTQKNISFIYSKGAPYKQGNHVVEIYNEGALIGKGTFNLR